LKRLVARFAADPRLDQELSITAWSEPLEDLLARLGRQTGVPLRFEGSEIGDQRVNVVLKEQSLARTLALLAETLDLYWRREGKASRYRYVLFQDAASHRREEERIASARERFEAGIYRMVDALKLTPQGIEELRATCGWAWHLEDPVRRLAIEIVGRLAPTHLKRALQTGESELPFDSLSPGDQALVLRFVEAANAAREKTILERGFPPGSHIIGDMTRPGSSVCIKVLGGTPVGWGSFIDLCLEAADGRGSYYGVSPGHTDAEEHALEKELLPPGFEKPRSEAQPDTEPTVRVTWTRWEEKTFLPWEEVLKAVAEGADLQIIGDSYLYYWWEQNSLLPSASALQNRPLAEVLDGIAPPFFYVWRREGDVYLFRHRNGWVEKRHNVPERDLRHWRERLKDGGRLTLDDLSQVALLTERQRGIVNHRGIPTQAAGRYRAVLCLYAALDSVQRGRLETTGLPLRDLRAPQIDLLRAWKPDLAANREGRLWLRREAEAVLFTLTTEGKARFDERVPMECGHSPTVG
jgi:hypothetical protein